MFVILQSCGLKQLYEPKLALHNAVGSVRPVVGTGQTGQYIVSARAFKRFLIALLYRLSGSLVALGLAPLTVHALGSRSPSGYGCDASYMRSVRRYSVRCIASQRSKDTSQT
jgi:hypothetical protein